jgi:hypothetical protein
MNHNLPDYQAYPRSRPGIFWHLKVEGGVYEKEQAMRRKEENSLTAVKKDWLLLQGEL